MRMLVCIYVCVHRHICVDMCVDIYTHKYTYIYPLRSIALLIITQFIHFKKLTSRLIPVLHYYKFLCVSLFMSETHGILQKCM